MAAHKMSFLKMSSCFSRRQRVSAVQGLLFAVEHGGPEVEALGCFFSDIVLYGSLVTVGYSANIWIPVSRYLQQNKKEKVPGG